MSEINRCPVCKRSKTEAIREQTIRRANCGIEGCVFVREIIKAIENIKKIKVVKTKLIPKKIKFKKSR